MNSLDQATAANIRLRLVDLVMSNGRKPDGTCLNAAEIQKECEGLAKFIFSYSAKEML